MASSRPLLFLITLFVKRDWVQKIILFQNNSFLKEFLACNGCFELFNKIKKGSGASFRCTFSALFFCKNVPYLILYQWTKFQCRTLSLSQDIKQNVLLIFTVWSSTKSWERYQWSSNCIVACRRRKHRSQERCS